ncbi:PREDICTED: uncharacterized protein LOC108553842 [Eufriesea mexicana]|uniref:uncharacterized protein LOC108553842 n=1 Tax=Eufriesea mexicana TaxID=516756 RepID=UPI00083C8B02|nr:PREDICTED: uncharacterized protein LOC108553842 [Eufriesea mexicana]
MKAIVIVSFLLLNCCVALPLNLEDNSTPLVSIPILLQESTGYESKRNDLPLVRYALLLSKLDGSEENFDGSLVEKRSVKEKDQEDLETAAGTYALRPLFVYRQQLAYRQRIRDAGRRGSRF